MPLSRRSFLRIASATTAALALGPSRWGWATDGSPFGELQDDPILRLPEGFSYQIVAETGYPLVGGRGPYPRPPFPDLNVVFRQRNGKLLLSTSHELPVGIPAPPPPPGEEYDRAAGGAVTSVLLNPDMSVAESAYNAGGMVNNCSGSGTPWGTVLTGEEATNDLEQPHGYIWEVDPDKHTKTRLDACGRFEHETAVVDPRTGYVYLTEDAAIALLYRMRPRSPGKLRAGGVLEAFTGRGWVTIADPSGEGKSTVTQGIDRDALDFKRLEGGGFDGGYFYFTETEDATKCGGIWRLDTRTDRLELFAEGKQGGRLCMPDNLAHDAAGNLFVCEDKSDAASGNENHVVFIDRASGKMATFAELALGNASSSPVVNVADEPTGPVFSPGGKVLFLNLQRFPDFGVTLAITGPFAKWRRRKQAAKPPSEAASDEQRVLASVPLVDMPVTAAAALVALRRRGRDIELPGGLDDVAADLGPRPEVPDPKVRPPRA